MKSASSRAAPPTGAIGRYPSPLRYPGGKGKIANFMKMLFIENDFIGWEYAEPYAGGASVALSLLFEEYASRVHINDIDSGLFAFWSAVLENTDELCERIWNARLTLQEWDRQRAVQGSANPDLLDHAFSTFFLNRTNRSGIISGGIIGGRAQLGAWGIDARFNKPALVARVEKIARFKNRIRLTCLDASAFLLGQVPRMPKATLVYLDPPYYVKGGDLYPNYYSHKDHARIAREVRALERPWIVSYDATPEILEMYAGLRHERYSLSYSAGPRGLGEEAMFFHEAVRQPRVDSPAGIRIQVVQALQIERLIG